MGRDIGTPAPAIPVAPRSDRQALPGPDRHTGPSVGKPMPQAFNRPKEPLRAERGNAVAYKDLQAAIDSALSARRDQKSAKHSSVAVAPSPD
ncbi:hypothetical protein MASR1M50_01130 [Burkholderiales bacterium]